MKNNMEEHKLPGEHGMADNVDMLTQAHSRFPFLSHFPGRDDQVT